jgi:KaiC/GvpD/RAD55 family RecA-like ATPase
MSKHAATVHSVHIYEDSAALISRLCGIVASSLKIGDAVLIVATSEHRDELVKELLSAGIDVRPHAREGLFTMVDAEEMLSTFMLNGMPDSDLFDKSVGCMLSDTLKAARSKSHSLTVFGEMVAVLWERGQKDAALQLEALWNDTLNERVFHLHCAYPRSGFINAGDEAAVCSTHSHIVQ